MHARRVAALLAGALLMSAPARGADFSAQLDRRWDYAKPEVSEARFREALRQYPAGSREALEIATQVARAQGLQRDVQRFLQIERDSHDATAVWSLSIMPSRSRMIRLACSAM